MPCLRVRWSRPGVPAFLLDQLLALLGPIYGYFAADPMLGRAMMREVAYSDTMSLGAGNLGAGEQALHYLRRMEAWRAGIQGVLDRGAAAGQWNASVATAPWSPPTFCGASIWSRFVAG